MQVSQKQSIDIDFKNISYSVGYKKPVTILKGINGYFRSGNLIGILGPSGAGKTTLLNLLAGYINNGMYGVIKINGQPRNMQKFKKLSCFIMQEDVLQQQLYVHELVALVANLKLGIEYSTKEKRKIIDNVIKTMGLENCINTRTENLSGGQLKRLAIALELINNPPVLFLDEPTTGLDNVVAKECIELLQALANQGRTIICTIHQPSDSLFYLFDQVYFMANGYCVYNGSVNQLVPFLSDINLPCPTNYNPADYIMEIVYNNEEAVSTMSKVTMNGALAKSDPLEKKISKTVSRQYVFANSIVHNDIKSYENFGNPFHIQVIILLQRMFMQMCRNRWMLTLQLIHHTISSLSLGMSFFWIGDNAAAALANYKYFMVIIVFYLYTYVMGPTLLFPFEIELIKREYFNRWYSLKAYYTALTLSTLPSMIIYSVLFNIIIYSLANLPMEGKRFFLFNVICILVALNSYGLGITIGSIFNCTAGAVVGSAIAAVLILACMYGMGYGDSISTFMQAMLFLMFTRQGLTAISCTILRDRPPMTCDEVFCYIENPEEILSTMGMKDARLDVTISILICMAIMYRIFAYFAMKRKVTPDSMLLSKYF